jgi:flagellar biosynthesis/type III secretory pathway chaperone
MSAQLADLVEWLEQFALESHLADPEQLEEVLADRQVVLNEIERADRSTLTPAQRAELKTRLAAVLTRDTAVLAALETLREAAKKALEQVSSGRAAARGYGKQSESPKPSVRRVG